MKHDHSVGGPSDESAATVPAAAGEFEPEFIERLRRLFQEQITFNSVLGLRVDSLGAERVSGHIEMRPELIGHHLHQRLHGGVISATLDAIGGLAVMAAVGARHLDESIDARLARFMRLGTIDLRIDYLRPATGPRYVATAQVLRLGSRVASTRMEFCGADGKLLATGAAAYMMS